MINRIELKWNWERKNKVKIILWPIWSLYHEIHYIVLEFGQRVSADEDMFQVLHKFACVT